MARKHHGLLCSEDFIQNTFLRSFVARIAFRGLKIFKGFISPEELSKVLFEVFCNLLWPKGLLQVSYGQTIFQRPSVARRPLSSSTMSKRPFIDFHGLLDLSSPKDFSKYIFEVFYDQKTFCPIPKRGIGGFLDLKDL